MPSPAPPGPPASPARVRRDPRQTVGRVRARYRLIGDDTWIECPLRDLSLSGALFVCGRELDAGHTIELLLVRADGGNELELGAEVLRRTDADPPEAAVRFLTLTRDATTWLAALLGASGADAASDGPALAGEAARFEGPSMETLALSSIRLHEQSLYELLALDPACPDGDIESRCEKLIADVAAAAADAFGRREDRLRVLHRSLLRMRPLWNDPVKRARYDLRWGFVRAEERILDATRGAGVHPHILAGIWYDLYRDNWREASKLVAAAKTDVEVAAALQRAIELEPFTLRWRQQLANLTRSPTLDEPDRAMSSPFADAPVVRGKIADLPLQGLLLSLCDEQVDAELEVRSLGKSLGTIGFTKGDVVIAVCGRHRGLEAIRRLVSLRDGEFVVRYVAPRAELRHMKEPAGSFVRKALE